MTPVIRREAPKEKEHVTIGWWLSQIDWYVQALSDLAAGRHVVGCTCIQFQFREHGFTAPGPRSNACTTIARAARDLESYEIEGKA